MVGKYNCVIQIGLSTKSSNDRKNVYIDRRSTIGFYRGPDDLRKNFRDYKFNTCIFIINY